MKATIFATKITVKCDEAGCEWEKEVASHREAATWHNRTCPACNEGIIIDDSDMTVLNLLIAAEDAGLLGLGEPSVAEEDVIRAEGVLDTSSLRRK